MKETHRTGFTLIQTLVVLSVIAVLAGISVPVIGKARYAGRNARCNSNLQQIYVAVRQYYQDQTRYPPSMAPLLPEKTNLVVVASGTQPLFNPTLRSPNQPGEFGYLRLDSTLVCPNDDNEYNLPHSSYDTSSDPLTSVWNFDGYNHMGVVPDDPIFENEVLVNDRAPHDFYKNPVRLSLSNRNAPPRTIVTHCRFHRTDTVSVTKPEDIYSGSRDMEGIPVRDNILRLDGSIKSYDVSQFSGRAPYTKWQQQDF